MAEIVRVSYTGREKTTGAVFDTTREEDAKKAGLYRKDVKYAPVVMILGENLLIKGFEEALKAMKEGQQKTVEMPPENAYGQRDPNLIKLIPLNAFTENDINPTPGMVLNLDNLPARVQSVSGGRVRVDFNHELAGKTLEFDLKLEEKITKEDEKVKALFEQLFPELGSKELKIAKQDKKLELTLPPAAIKVKNLQGRKLQLIQNLKKYLGYETVKVTEEY